VLRLQYLVLGQFLRLNQLTDDTNAFKFGDKIAVSSGSFGASIAGKAMMFFIPG
jgi:hypothetical protein